MTALGWIVLSGVLISDRCSLAHPVRCRQFHYIGASDLVPEVNKQHRVKRGVVHLLTFVAGPAMMLMPQLFF